MALTLVTSDLIHGLDYSKLTGTITTWNQDTTGNADTATLAAGATILATARNIGGVSFNGSAAINLPGVNTSGNQNTSGVAATATLLATARTIGGVSFNGSTSINLPGVNISGNQNTSGNSATVTNGVYTVGNQTIAGAKTFSDSGTFIKTSSSNSTTPLVVRNSGSTAIGTESKIFLSTVAGDDRGAYISSIITDSSNGNALILATNAAGASPAERMRISSGGDVKIGTADGLPLMHGSVAGNSSYCTYSFVNDPNTGMIRTGADTLALVTAGSTRLTISSGGAATFANTLRSGNFAIGSTPVSFGTGVPTILLQGAETNGRGGAIIFKESDGTVTSNIYSTTGADGYGTVINAAQGSFKVSVGALAATKLTISSGGEATFGSTTDYKIGLNDSAGTNQWWLKSYTNGSFAFHENNVGDKFNILAGGNVGIGTTGPARKLTVMEQGLFTNSGTDGGNSYVGAAPILTVSTDGNGNASANYANNAVFLVGIGGGNSTSITTQHFRVNLNGNVGIGTNSPYSMLQVGDPEQTSSAILTIASRYGGSNPILNFRSGHPSNSNVWNTVQIHGDDDGNYNGKLEFKTATIGQAAPDTKMIIKATGNVGIGTTLPATELQIGDYTDATQAITIATTGNGNGRINFYDNNDTEGGLIKVTGKSGGSTMTFAGRWNVDNPKVTFDLVNGNVGIGNSLPAAKLDVRGAVAVGRATEDGGVTVSLTGGGDVSGGTLEMTQGWTGTMSSNDTVVFTYNAVSWKSWILQYKFASTNGLTSGEIGGYNNNSDGNSNTTHINSHGMSIGKSRVGQSNIITFTFSSLGVHPFCHFKYYQSGGDGAPAASRASITLNS